MFTIYATYDPTDVDGSTVEITVFDSIMTDAPALRDLYVALNDRAMDCEMCRRTVLEFTTVDDTRYITQFSPFGASDDTVVCAPCILQGAALGHSVLHSNEPTASHGRHAA